MVYSHQVSAKVVLSDSLRVRDLKRVELDEIKLKTYWKHVLEHAPHDWDPPNRLSIGTVLYSILAWPRCWVVRVWSGVLGWYSADHWVRLWLDCVKRPRYWSSLHDPMCAFVTLVGALGDGVLDRVLSGKDTDDCLWSIGACVTHDISSSEVYSGTLLSNPWKTCLNRIIVRSCVSMCHQCGSSKDVRVCKLFPMATTHT